MGFWENVDKLEFAPLPKITEYVSGNDVQIIDELIEAGRKITSPQAMKDRSYFSRLANIPAQKRAAKALVKLLEAKREIQEFEALYPRRFNEMTVQADPAGLQERKQDVYEEFSVYDSIGASSNAARKAGAFADIIMTQIDCCRPGASAPVIKSRSGAAPD